MAPCLFFGATEGKTERNESSVRMPAITPWSDSRVSQWPFAPEEQPLEQMVPKFALLTVAKKKEARGRRGANADFKSAASNLASEETAMRESHVDARC